MDRYLYYCTSCYCNYLGIRVFLELQLWLTTIEKVTMSGMSPYVVRNSQEEWLCVWPDISSRMNPYVARHCASGMSSYRHHRVELVRTRSDISKKNESVHDQALRKWNEFVQAYSSRISSYTVRHFQEEWIYIWSAAFSRISPYAVRHPYVE